MTARQVFEGMLIELSKVNAPSLLLSEFNYYFNKAINNYINKIYNKYDINQQSTDDIRVLKATSVIGKSDGLKRTYDNSDSSYKINNLQGATYEITLPMDYLHLLNCVCVYHVKKTWKCYDGDTYVQFPAKRLTSDAWSTIVNDYYNRPTPERPYYFIHNINSSNEIPTNSISYNDNNQLIEGTDMVGEYKVNNNGYVEGIKEIGYNPDSNKGSNFERVIQLTDGDGEDCFISSIEKATAYRYGNPSKVRMEIRYGKDDSVFELIEVAVDYLKAPQFIRLTQEQLDLTEDTSQIMEFPDYVCQEIINELTILVMQRTGDPRLQTQIAVNQTIAQPAQAQSQQSAVAASQATA